MVHPQFEQDWRDFKNNRLPGFTEKEWIRQMKQKYRICRATVFNWIKHFKRS